MIDSLLKKLGKGSSHRKNKDSDEGIFSLTSAYITLQTKLGLSSTNRCGICIKNVNGAYFSDTIREVQDFLRISSSEFQTEHVLVNDKLGYLWIMLRGMSVEDILVASNGIADTIADRGFRDQMLAAVFEFKKIVSPNSSVESTQLETQFLVYNYKRERFYPFVPLGAQEKRRSDLELTLMSIISKEVPWETDMTVWYPMWDMPFDKLRI
ncbi:MAG: PspA-associated protein PspAB [Nitrososphaeraceae archaeon]